jgi:predicted kinase
MEKCAAPTCILFCGLPGSGKTTLAKQLEKQKRGVRICTDDWQDDLDMNHNENNFRKKLQKRLYTLGLDLLSYGQSIILEDGLWMAHERAEKLADARKHGAIVELHYFDLSFEELWKRLAARNQHLPGGAINITKEQLQKCWDVFEKPTADELAKFDKVFTYKDTSPNPGL